ncbi:J domain-containing protein [Paeniglutamicibacter sp. NPDC091659]|uniref:J domain-containing protein n=1 Tax=Paeniglutamicibacter sp. NPDC091659 TaxID=3364389 RepID=UPI0037F8B255
MIDAFPLQWPTGRARTPKHEIKWGNLNKMPSGRIRSLLVKELQLMGSDGFVISSNVEVRRDGLPYSGQKPPDDAGVVLYFQRKSVDIAISCDAWATADANLRAIGLTIEAIRGMERWGTEEMVDRAFVGFKALPERTIVTPYQARLWYDVLEVSPTASPQIIKAAYRQQLLKHHPDQGGELAAFNEVQKAYKEATS